MFLKCENTIWKVHFNNALNFIHVNIMTCKIISEKYIKHVFWCCCRQRSMSDLFICSKISKNAWLHFTSNPIGQCRLCLAESKFQAYFHIDVFSVTFTLKTSMYNIFRLILSLIPFLWSIDISTTFLCSRKRVRICMHSFKMHVILVLHVCYLSIHEKLFCICRTNI